MAVTKKIQFKSDQFQKAAAALCAEFQNRGFEIYWVGGAVRDLILKRPNFDLDLATSASPAEIKRVARELGLRSFEIGEKFGTVGILLQGRRLELTSFRAEKGYVDSRHPSKVRFGVSAEFDAGRRDFTVNALFYDPVSGELKDFHGGLQDLAKKQLRFVGNAAKRIKEDPLRCLRAVRFATTLKFKIAPADLRAIKKSAALVKKISGERIKQELDKLLAVENFMHGIRLLDTSGLLAAIFPEVARLKKVRQSKNYHAEGNVFVHTMLVLENLQSEDLLMRYAGLLHDIGKYQMGRKTVKEGRPHISFSGHAQKSGEMILKIARRLHFSRTETQKLYYLALHHMDLRPIEMLRQATLIRWSKNPWFADLVRLRIADSLGAIQTSASGKVVKKEMGDWQRLLAKVKRWQKPQPEKIIDGRDVMRVLKLKPGKRVGEILDEIYILQRQGKIKTREQGITFLKSLDKRKG